MATPVKHQGTVMTGSSNSSSSNDLLFRPWDRQQNGELPPVKGSQTPPGKPLVAPNKPSSGTMVHQKFSKIPVSGGLPFGLPAAAFAPYHNHHRSNTNANLLSSLMGGHHSAPCFFPPEGKAFSPQAPPSSACHLKAGQLPFPFPEGAMGFSMGANSSAAAAAAQAAANSFFNMSSFFGYPFPGALPGGASLFPSSPSQLETLMANNKSFFGGSGVSSTGPPPPPPMNVSELEKAMIDQQVSLLERTPKKQRPKRFSCPHCQVSFSNNGQLKGHIRIHTGERPFVCDGASCGKTFTRNEELTRHKRIHSGLRPFACSICSKRFGRKDHLKKHVKTHQRPPPMPMPLGLDPAALSYAALAYSSWL